MEKCRVAKSNEGLSWESAAGARRRFFVLVSRDADNIAGLSTQLQFGIYKAIKTNKRVCFGYRTVFMPSIFKRVGVVWVRHRHAIHKLKSPYIVNCPLKAIGGIAGFMVGVRCFLAFIVDLVRYKLQIHNQVQKYPRFGLGVNDLFEANNSPGFDKRNDSSWKELYEVDLHLKLPDKDREKCSETFRKLGLEEKRYVCLHIRTPAYKGTSDLENAGFRNATPSNYISAIKFLIKNGMKVVRLGDRVENLLPQIDGLIDYASSEYKSEEMDIYLIQNSFFFFGTNSGIYDTAMLLSVPVLAVNVSEFLIAKPYKRVDLFVYKRIFSKKLGRVLTFKELFSQDQPPTFDGHEFIENSSEDLGYAVEEQYRNLISGNVNRAPRQVVFSNHLNSAVRRWIDGSAVADAIDKYRDVKLERQEILAHLEYNGSFVENFVSKYYA